MGIQGLTKLIADTAPQALKDEDIKNFFGRTVAVDASMTLYQFVIAVRPDDLGQYTLTNDQGEATSHLQGMFYRTIRMITNGIKPVYVFDGKPPELKTRTLAKRKERKADAEEKLEDAEAEGDKEAITKLNKQTVRVTKEMNEEAKRLLHLMGVVVVEAPCEAEAQCAELVKAGKCFGVATEDMDTLTCGTPCLLRHMTYSEARKVPITEIRLERVLEGLNVTMDEFIDLCILLGCDYSDKIRGIGPKRALEFIQKYKNIETILKHLDKEKYQVPEDFPFQEIRDYFRSPPVTPAADIPMNFTDPDEDGLVQFLCVEKGFNEERVRAGVAKIRAAKGKSVQQRLTNFFQVKPATPTPKTPAAKAGTKAPPQGIKRVGSDLAKKADPKKVKKE